VVLYEKPDRKSKVVGQLKQGQTVEDHQQKTLVVQAGKLTVPDDPESEDLKELKKQGVKAGDVVVGLQYLGEGTHRVCVGDKLFDMNGFEQNESPRTEAWSLVRSRNGSGWAPGVDWYRMLMD
jgi:hypothetical protein